MKVDGVTVHGFRSAFRDWAAECTNFTNEVCEAALAHVIENKAEAAYRRGDLFDKRRKLMEAWAVYCAVPKSGKVVAFKRLTTLAQIGLDPHIIGLGAGPVGQPLPDNVTTAVRLAPRHLQWRWAVVMPRYKPRLSFATRGGGDPVLEISCADWHRIEKICGHALAPKVRSELFKATWTFLALLDSEEDAEPLAAAQAHLESIKKAAAQLRDVILEGNAKSDAKRYATSLINQSFADTRVTGKLALIGSVMVALEMACEKASQQLVNQLHAGRKKGATWQQWLVDLAHIAATHGLPVAVERTPTRATDRLRLSHS